MHYVIYVDEDEDVFSTFDKSEAIRVANRLLRDSAVDVVEVFEAPFNRYSGEWYDLGRCVYRDSCEESEADAFHAYDRMTAIQQHEYDRNAAESERLEMWRNEY